MGHGLAVGIVSWVLLGAALVALAVRLAMKLALSRTRYKFVADDAAIVLASLCSIGQTAAISMQALHALGRHMHSLDADQILLYMKTSYASCLLDIANFTFARLSICLLVQQILPGKVQQRVASAVAIVTILWGISGLLATAFPCDMPNPWNYLHRHCYNFTSFVNYMQVSNILLEFVIIALPLVVWNLRLSERKRLSVSLVFASRLLVVGPVAAQLVYFNRNNRKTDFTYHAWQTTLCMQVAQNFNVITACLPLLHPFVLDILSGAVNPRELEFRPSTTRSRMLKRFDPTRSTSSEAEMKADATYVAPLATYGLDGSSSRLDSPSPCASATSPYSPYSPYSSHPSATSPTAPLFASPLPAHLPHENIFSRTAQAPCTAPPDAHDPFSPASPSSACRKSAHHRPKSLSQCGVLPVVDWDSCSGSSAHSHSVSGDGHHTKTERGQCSSRNALEKEEVVFNREKVVSITHEKDLYFKGDSWKWDPGPDGAA